MTILFAPALPLLSEISVVSQAVCASLWRASWIAGLAALSVWTICRALPRLPASTRCWLWRFTLLKFVLALFLPLAAIGLPVLQTQSAVTPSASPSISGLADTSTTRLRPAAPGGSTVQFPATPSNEPGTPATTGAATTILPAAFLAQERAMHGVADYGATSANAAAFTQISPAAPSSGEFGTGSVWTSWFGIIAPILVALYVAGVAVCLGRLVRCALQTRRFLRVPRRAMGDSQSVLDALSLCRQLGIRRVPRLLEATDVEASQLVAAFPPIVLLPGPFQKSENAGPRTSDRHAYRLMLAHELAHLRRGDLWWSGFAAVAHTLFFFHPLLWLTRREEELAREMACDALVLATTATSPSRYGALLVEVAARQRSFLGASRGATPALASLGFADEIALVRRRLIALKAAATPLSPRRLRLLIGTAGTATLMALLPWRLAAAHGPESGRRLPSALAVTALPAPQIVHGSVEGRVSLLPDNEAGANVVVHLDPIDGRSALKISQVPTDVAGEYRFEGVPAGTYRLWLQPDIRLGYGDRAAVPNRSSLHIGISQSQPVVHRDLVLTRNVVSIIGQVADRRTGQFVDDVEVGAGTVEGGPESVVVWKPVQFADRGYQLYAPPGAVAVYTRYGRYEPPVIPGADFGTKPANPYRLLPSDTPRVSSIIQAKPGHAVRADLTVDAHYLPRGGASKSLAPITGRVIGVDGHPAAGVAIYFFNFLESDSQQRFPADASMAYSDAQGKFRLEGVPQSWAGCRIGIRARDERESGGLSRHLVVTLPGQRTAALAPLTLHLRSDEGTDLCGQVVDDAGRPAAYVPVSLYCMTWKAKAVHLEEATITDAQGNYHFGQIWSNLDGWLLAEPGDQRLGSLLEWGSHSKVVGRRTYLPPLVLKPTTQQIAGVVVTPDGKPVPRQLIIAFTRDLKSNCSGGSAETDAHGRFRVDHLVAGSYDIHYGAGDGTKITQARGGDMNLRLVVQPSVGIKPRPSLATKPDLKSP